MLSDVIQTIQNKINQIITSVNNIQRYIGFIGNSDKSTITYKVDFLLKNLYEYVFKVQRIKLVASSSGYRADMGIDMNSISDMLIMVLHKNGDGSFVELLDIDKSDVTINLKSFTIPLYLLEEELGDLSEYVLYVKVVYQYRKLIELS